MDTKTQRSATGAFLTVEHLLYIALGAVLAVAAVAALADVVYMLVVAMLDWNGTASLLPTVDRLLFVLMMAEILHTVRVSINSGSLTCEPFLIVGLIASIRRVLVITLQSSQVAGSATDHAEAFQTSMVELGVLAGLILVMVASIYILRRAGAGAGAETKAD